MPSDSQLPDAPPGSAPCSGSACRVWLVRELVGNYEIPKVEREQDCFVLAVSALEAATIVGESDRRRIIRVEEICPISKLPADKYKVVACTPDDKVSEPAL